MIFKKNHGGFKGVIYRQLVMFGRVYGCDVNDRRQALNHVEFPEIATSLTTKNAIFFLDSTEQINIFGFLRCDFNFEETFTVL